MLKGKVLHFQSTTDIPTSQLSTITNVPFLYYMCQIRLQLAASHNAAARLDLHRLQKPGVFSNESTSVCNLLHLCILSS